VATASFIGTAIEFYDFYVYATAAALVIGPVFFPQTSGTAQMLAAFLTFGIAFLARPLGSALFGHFGDRIGRKSTLVASLLLMGVCTTLIGVLPGYDSIGAWAPILLCVLRFGQGLGLGGEWGGAALLATENAPKGKRAWFGMFPQLGPSIGFLAANGLFLTWPWASATSSSAVGLADSVPAQRRTGDGRPVCAPEAPRNPGVRQRRGRQERVKMPLVELFSQYWAPVLLGAAAMVVCYALFYISTVFSLSYGVATLGYSRETFLGLLCFAVLFMGRDAAVGLGQRPLRAQTGADRRWRAGDSVGLLMEPLLTHGSTWGVALFLCIELFLMGVTLRRWARCCRNCFRPTCVIPAHRRPTTWADCRRLGRTVLRPEAGGDGRFELCRRVCVGGSGAQLDCRAVPERNAQ
jgi:MFS family permease